MDLKALKWQIFHGTIAWRMVFRIFVVTAALSIIPFVHIFYNTDIGMLAAASAHDCVAKLGDEKLKLHPGSYWFQGHFLNPLWDSYESLHCEESMNLTVNVVKELVRNQLLSHNPKALCVGEGSASAALAMGVLGFSNAIAFKQLRLFSFKWKQFVYELDYKDQSFDLVFARDLDKLSVPALLMLEIERVLKSGGIGAVIIHSSTLDSLVRSATPVSSLLKTSSVIHVGYISNFTLVVFKKRFENSGYFEHYSLPADCPALTNNRPFIPQMEPLVKEKPIGFEKKFSYLPKFVDVSSKRRLVYVDIGAGRHLNSNVTNWFLPSYPVDQKAFNIYFVDHNTSVLLSYVKQPGITFVYHPGLAETKAEANVGDDDEGLDPSVEDEGFNFLAWFKETVHYADFVVLKMNAGKVELKFLLELFESGVICFVDEIFLSCSDAMDDGRAFLNGGCMNLFNDLRNSGVFVHQWWGNHTRSM